MDKISCDICMDLIPLIKDNVASDDSYKAVMNHISQCSHCRSLLEDKAYIYDKIPEIDDKKVISKIRNELVFAGIILILIGSVIGVAFSESENMFYNILIMPIIGGFSYFLIRKKSYLIPIIMFGFVYIYHLVKYMIEGGFEGTSLLIAPLTWSFIYSGLCALGVFIGFLLYIAFRREK